MIYFITALLDRQVHAQGLGFTTVLYLWGWGATASEAERNVAAYLRGNEIGVKRFAGTTQAIAQDVTKYCFPQQIYGLPHDVAVSAIRGQALPDSWISEELKDLAKRRKALAKGRVALAQESELQASLGAMSSPRGAAEPQPTHH